MPPSPARDDAVARRLLVLLASAWFGILAHDLVEFGLPRPESSLLYLGLYGGVFLAWRRATWRGAGPRWTLVVLTGLSLLGALTSVLPLALWPFTPEQTTTHYAVHAVWTVTTVPLLWWLVARGGAMVAGEERG